MIDDPVEAARQLAINSDDPDGWNNFAYFGDKDLCKTWAIVGPHRNRDSDVLANSNWDCIVEDLNRIFPDGETWEILGCSHWAVGWMDSVMCQIFSPLRPEFIFVPAYDDNWNQIPWENEDGYLNPASVSEVIWENVEEDDLSPVFLWLHEVAMSLDEYPIYDETHFSEAEFKDAVECINLVAPFWVDNRDDNDYQIASWLCDSGIYEDEWDEDYICLAALNLGLIFDENDALEWWANNVDFVGASPKTVGWAVTLIEMGQTPIPGLEVEGK